MIHGDVTWERFNGKKDGTLWYYQSILDIALESNASHFLQANLQDVVGDMGGDVPISNLDDGFSSLRARQVKS
jgi:hypothetical protein